MTHSARTATAIRSTIGFGLAVLLSLNSTSPATAQPPYVLYSTNFNSPTYTDGPLNTTTAAPATVGQDGWLWSSGGVNLIPVSNTATNGFVTLTTNGQDLQRPFDGAQTVTANSVFFKATINVTSAQATGDYFMHFTDGGTGNFYARTYIRSSAGGFTMALGTSSGTGVTYSTTDLTLNTSYDILVRYDFVSGTANDTGALYINPTTIDGTGDTPYINATTIGTDATNIRAIAIRQGTAANAPGLTIDNIEVFSMVPVPEPGTVLGVAAGVLGLARVLRRRVGAIA